MNTRERFLAISSFEKAYRTLRWEMGYWAGTVRRWYKEGLPCNKNIPDSVFDGNGVDGEDLPLDPETIDPIDAPKRNGDVSQYFGHDEPFWRLPLNNYLYPLFDKEVLEDHGTWILHRNEFGVIVKGKKDRRGFPDWVETPVKTRDDWEQIKAERLQPTLEGRLWVWMVFDLVREPPICL